jgi:hypothetical protein
MDNVVLGVLAIVSIFAASQLFRGFAAKRECLALGYADARTLFFSPTYCVVRTDQSDVVITLEEARKKGRLTR